MIGAFAAKPSKLIVGLMSGTSLDGIDAAVVRIDGAGTDSRIELVHFLAESYDDELREKLKELCTPDRSGTDRVCAMNFLLGHRFADAVKKAVNDAGLAMGDIDLVASHGQTIWHIPEDDATDPYLVRSTLQIGDLSVIAKETGLPVAGDFRTADMAVGGQGAPLVPYADFILFRDHARGRIAQNIGGIGNCTAIPAGAEPEQVVAFDTGPGNMLIDQAVYQLSGGRKTYDDGGSWAAEGSVNEALLEEMLQHPYFKRPPAKTTGREMFGKAYAAEWLARASADGLSAADTIATFTAFTARSIADSYKDFVLPAMAVHDVLVSGGGMHNATLLRMMGGLLPEQAIVRSDALGVSGDAKEAMVFALLGNNMLHGIPNNLPSATGASCATVMGKLALP